MWTEADEKKAIKIIEHNLPITGINVNNFILLYNNFINFLKLSKTDYEYTHYMRLVNGMFPFIE